MTKNMKTAVFIDGPSLYQASRSIGAEVDYRKLKKYLETTYDCFRTTYYAAIPEGEAYSPVRPLVDWLSYNGFAIVTKPLREIIDKEGVRHYKGNMNVEIALDMVSMAPRIEHLVLFSGDSDMRPAVEAAQKFSQVSIISVLKNVVMISDGLRRQADRFIDLSDIIDSFTRDPQ